MRRTAPTPTLHKVGAPGGQRGFAQAWPGDVAHAHAGQVGRAAWACLLSSGRSCLVRRAALEPRPGAEGAAAWWAGKWLSPPGAGAGAAARSCPDL